MAVTPWLSVAGFVFLGTGVMGKLQARAVAGSWHRLGLLLQTLRRGVSLLEQQTWRGAASRGLWAGKQGPGPPACSIPAFVSANHALTGLTHSPVSAFPSPPKAEVLQQHSALTKARSACTGNGRLLSSSQSHHLLCGDNSVVEASALEKAQHFMCHLQRCTCSSRDASSTASRRSNPLEKMPE